MASPRVMRIPISFSAPFCSCWSALTFGLMSMMRLPTSSCITRPEVTIGLIPSSMTVPLRWIVGTV